MINTLVHGYTRALLEHNTPLDDADRARAYELGRAAISAGLGVLDVVHLHATALKENPEIGPGTFEFLSEALAPFEMVLRGFRDANSTLRQFAQTLEDRVKERTSELQHAERLLREQERLLRSVLDAMIDAVAVVERDGRFTLFNPAAERLIGVSPANWLPPNWTPEFGLFDPDEMTPMAPARTPRIRALAGERVQDEEVFIRSPGMPGGTHFRVSASPLEGDGGITGCVVVFRDDTARRAAQQAARKAEERLARSQRLEAIGQLAGGVAHDFNNLLAVISSYAGLLLEDIPPGDPRADDVREIEKAATSAASLTRQLLAFSSQQVLLPTSVDLNEIVTDVAKMLRRTIGERIQLSMSLHPQIGPVMADRGQIEQIIMNLSVNARDAMPEGGMLTIETGEQHHGIDASPAQPGDWVVLAVTDTGIGMDAATKSRIFEPFFTTKEMGRGTGLGLATVYGIVQQSGGSIAVYSEPGHGTSFRICLPRAPSAGGSGVAPEQGPGTGTGTILLVEDEEAVRIAATRVLRRAGYTVLVAENGGEARSFVAAYAGDIHLLLTDVVLPGMTGPELANEVARLRPGIRVLYVSGYSPAAVRDQSRIPMGAVFLHKPFTPASLREKVEEILSANTRPGE